MKSVIVLDNNQFDLPERPEDDVKMISSVIGQLQDLEGDISKLKNFYKDQQKTQFNV
ncbi:hypothetical protein [Catenovulum maritimum]|uniref:hypothetical protein n=1 Tax=Catenovulum maritimum TaxID=1513271 RepID=UPI0012B5FED0|nr:hypothetical protein [Catenovulum maritimum]